MPIYSKNVVSLSSKISSLYIIFQNYKIWNLESFQITLNLKVHNISNLNTEDLKIWYNVDPCKSFVQQNKKRKKLWASFYFITV